MAKLHLFQFLFLPTLVIVCDAWQLSDDTIWGSRHAGRSCCASSRGLGRACATSLARAGVEVVINGMNEARITAAGEAIRRETGLRSRGCRR